MYFRVKRIDDGKSNSKVIALSAESRKNSRSAEIKRPHDEQCREHYREENHRLADQNGE